GGPDVEASQLEHPIPLGPPATEAADGGQTLDQLLVASSRRAGENDGAVELLGREIAERRELVRREPGRSECGVGGRAQRLRRERAAGGRAHAAVDRLRRAAGELLEDDRTSERGEGPVRVARAVPDRTDTRDEVGEDRVARGDLVDRSCKR